MNKLEEYRNKLDVIDDQIALLYANRMELVKKIADAKKELNVPTAVPDREKKIVNRVTALVDEPLKIYTKRVFETVFETSKSYQSTLSTQSGELFDMLTELTKRDRAYLPSSASVACQGVLGSYSSIATSKMFEISDITYVKTFESVFQAVQSGQCQFGILPLENSTAGSVNAVYDLLKKYKAYIVASTKISVRHCLLGNYGATTDKIKEIYSHEQAINQCSEYLKKFPNASVIPCENTAIAAKRVSESGRTDVASISSKECSELYGLHIVDGDIADNSNNYTRFICITNRPTLYANSTKISLMANLPNEAGSLSKVLGRFYAEGISLTKLESRPVTNSVFEFVFYFDLEADIHKSNVINLLCELDKNYNLTFLGSYSEI